MSCRNVMSIGVLLVAVCAMLSGCGTIKVSVDVLNPEYVHRQVGEVAVGKAFRELQAAKPGEVAKRVDTGFDAFAREVRGMAVSIRQTAASLPGAQRPPIVSSARMLDDAVGDAGDYRRRAALVGIELEDVAKRVRAEAARLNYGGDGPMPGEVRALMLEFQAKDKALSTSQVEFVRSTQLDLRERVATAARATGAAAAASAPAATASAAQAVATQAVTTAAEPGLQAVKVQVSAAESASTRSIIGDGSLAATEFAYFVASAPDNLWEKDFNRAYADTKLGNADIVIRLNSTADFSVKGLLFDASKVAQVASKVLTQTVLLSAQVAGVPVPTASTTSTGTTSGGDSLSKSSSDLATLDAAQAARDARVAGQKSAMRSLARSLLAATPQLTSAALATKPKDDADRLAIHGGIDSSYTALKTLLSLQDIQ